MELWQGLRSKRFEANLSQSNVADKLHISHQAISNWENNKSIPDLDTLKALSQIYGCSCNDFFDNKENYDLPLPEASEEKIPNNFDGYEIVDSKVKKSLKGIPLDPSYFKNLPEDLIVRPENVYIECNFDKSATRSVEKLPSNPKLIDRIILTGITVASLRSNLQLQSSVPIITIHLVDQARIQFHNFLNKQQELSKKAFILSPLKVQVFPDDLPDGYPNRNSVRLEVHQLSMKAIQYIDL